jgi:hypothetical protein
LYEVLDFYYKKLKNIGIFYISTSLDICDVCTGKVSWATTMIFDKKNNKRTTKPGGPFQFDKIHFNVILYKVCVTPVMQLTACGDRQKWGQK